MGKAKRKIDRNRIEPTLKYVEKEKKSSPFNKIKKYISFRWFQPTFKSIAIITLAFFGCSFLVAYPVGLLISNFKLAYVVSHALITSFIIVFCVSRGDRKQENNLEFIVRWFIVGMVLGIISVLSI